MEDKKYRILIVDDNESDAEMLMNGIENEERILLPVYSGKAALRQARKDVPDLILLDVMMPDIDGYEVCRILKSDKQTANIPVIFLTGLNDKNDVAKGLELGAVDYIIKPYNLVEINARIKNHLLLQKRHKRSLSLLKGLASSSSDVAIMFDSKMNILEILGQYEKYLPELSGIELGRNLSDFLPEQLKRQFATALTTVISTGEKFEFETEITNEGEKYILSISMSVVEQSQGEDMVISANILDVTAIRREERQIDLTYEYQKRSRFFNNVLTGVYSTEQQRQLLSIYGIENKKPLVCYTVATSVEDPEYHDANLRINIGEWLLEKGYGWIWHSNFGIGILMQYPSTEEEIKKVAILLKESIEMRFPNIRLRIGIACNSNPEWSFKELYYDALASLMKAIDCDTDCALLPHEKNSIYEIIVRMFERMNVDVFIEKVLGEIMRHDKKNNSELLNTLEHFIMATSIKNVAAELFIHPNTVLWRKQKIEEILSCDMENIDVRSEINIAFKLMRVRNFLQIAR
jgi:PAS domain S-box-containing protein